MNKYEDKPNMKPVCEWNKKYLIKLTFFAIGTIIKIYYSKSPTQKKIGSDKTGLLVCAPTQCVNLNKQDWLNW